MKVQQNTDVQVTNLKKQDLVSENDVVAPKEKEKKKIISVSGADLTGESPFPISPQDLHQIPPTPSPFNTGTFLIR